MAVGNMGIAVRLQKETSTASPLKTFLSRYFYFSMSLVMTVLIVWGFSHTVVPNLFRAKPAKPLLLWIHGAAFSAWMVLFIVQSGLVRIRKVSIHRTLGWFGAALAATMFVLGLAVAVYLSRWDIVVLHQPDIPQFLSIPFWDMAFFGTCMALAIAWRKKPDFHRRLVFLATCQLMDAGIGRFDFWFNHSIFFVGVDLLVLAGMLRDVIVDARVHKVYLYALPVMVVGQTAAVYLWRGNPAWWQAVTHAILGV